MSVFECRAKKKCRCACYSLQHSHVRCVLRATPGTLPILSPHTRRFMASPQETAMNVTSAALEQPRGHIRRPGSPPATQVLIFHKQTELVQWQRQREVFKTKLKWTRLHPCTRSSRRENPNVSCWEMVWIMNPL